MHTLLPLLLALSPLHAHKPSFGSDGPFTGADTAFEIDDPDVSIVVYQRLTCEDDQLWLTFEAEAGFPLWFQLGVPVIERLADDRPAMALLAPGLPEPEEALPFEVPDGLGALVYRSDDVEEPEEFYEPFTQSTSWVYAQDEVTLPETGRGYVVAWLPEPRTTKLWLATGLVEDFSDVGLDAFAVWNRKVNDFHETGRLEPVPEDLAERSCLPAEEPPDATGGCAVSGGSTVPFPLLIGIAAAFRRRRS